MCGFNNGAKRYDRIKRMYLFCIKASTLFMLVFGAIVFVFSPQLVAFFRDDPDVISAGTPLLRFQCVTGFLQGIIIMTNMIVQNMGKTLLASFLAIARQGVFFIPLVLILPQFFGLTGLQMTQSAADVLTAAFTAIFTVKTLRSLDKLIEENQNKGEVI